MGLQDTYGKSFKYTITAACRSLNRIDLEFSEKIFKEKEVLLAWKEYLDLLGDQGMPQEQWNIKRMDLLIELLQKMGNVLDYNFDKTHIKNARYSPSLYGRVEQEQEAIRQGFLEVLEGRRSLPFNLINKNTNHSAEKTQTNETV